MISIKKGIDLPIGGHVENPDTIVSFLPDAPVAVLGRDYPGLRPTMMVAEGNVLKKGEPLFADKKNPGVHICAPLAGTVRGVVRGERRRLLAVVIEPSGDGAVSFSPMTVEDLDEAAAQTVKERLCQAGLWAALRQRPFSKIPPVAATAQAIFVNAMDSNPLAPDPLLALAGRTDDYHAGLRVLTRLTAGKVHVCHAAAKTLPEIQVEGVVYHAFSGIHPAGLVGTHIHFIEPVGREKTVWYLGLQDLLAFGRLFLGGTIDNERIISLAGPGVKEAKMIRTVKGVNLSALLAGNLRAGEQRVISGSVFAGRQVEEATDFLGAYDQQVVVLPEGRDSVFLEFLRPGANAYSRTRAYLGRFLGKAMPFTTAVQGSPRPIVPFGIYEEVMPLDILPTLLLKALVVKDTDTAVQLGALELDEEDIALLTYVDPGKHDFGAILRENLEKIAEEG